jgi:peptidylprolyl isomerase
VVDNSFHTLTLELDTGTVKIKFRPDLAPNHVQRIGELANEGFYNDVPFHRVIAGFMAQGGDGGNKNGTGGSKKPNLKQEFSTEPHVRGVCSMARTNDPNSANSQFFIMFAPAPHLDGQYTVVGKVISGQDVIDALHRGDGPNGEVSEPDYMEKVTVKGG